METRTPLISRIRSALRRACLKLGFLKKSNKSVRFQMDYEFSFTNRASRTPTKMVEDLFLGIKLPCINRSISKDSKSSGEMNKEYGIEIDGGEICRGHVESDEESVNTKAEGFITNFHRQLALERQTSVLRYQEMLDRGLA
ncbi:hypothetical protein SUGI_1074780 [Cryptomeria japonica]|nr:hypothetical protein SUGI_1074780 [Cryptomeria japonica]